MKAGDGEVLSRLHADRLHLGDAMWISAPPEPCGKEIVFLRGGVAIVIFAACNIRSCWH